MTAFFDSLCNFSFFKRSDLARSSLNLQDNEFIRKNGRSSTCVQTSLQPQRPENMLKLKSADDLEAVQDGDPLFLKTSSNNETRKEMESPTKMGRDRIPVTEKDFTIVKILRSGRNWKIYKVQKETDGKIYAMKLINRRVIEKNSKGDQVVLEKEVFEKARHPFIPRLNYYFETERKIFIINEFVESGGSLHEILKQFTRFSEDFTRFYIAEILLTLEYLHKELKVAHNGLRLRKLLVDTEGHLRLYDLSQVKRITPNTSSPSGTDSPTATPINSLTQKEASIEELDDFWDLGCIIYELMTGRKPFVDNGEESPMTESSQPSPTRRLSWPCTISNTAKDLISRLLNNTVDKRLGFNSVEEIMHHPFFAQINWDKIYSKSVYPPMVPPVNEDDDVSEGSGEDQELEEIRMQRQGVSYKMIPIKIMENTTANSDDEFSSCSYNASGMHRLSRTLVKESPKK